MIEKDEEKYDFEDHSFSEKVKRSSSCYEPTEYEQKNLRLIEDYIKNNKYESRKSIEVHMEYLEHLLNRLSNARKVEVTVCPSNAEMDTEINRVKELSRLLAAKLSTIEG